jgi:hypothetical protein
VKPIILQIKAYPQINTPNASRRKNRFAASSTREDGRIKLHCLFGLVIEPQAWDDLVYIVSFRLFFVEHAATNRL